MARMRTALLRMMLMETSRGQAERNCETRIFSVLVTRVVGCMT